MNNFQYDVFICHASADKGDVAEPLSRELQQRGCKVWLDKMTLKIGDNLRRKIDEGLALAKFGIVILSPNFFSRQWPQYELDGLLAREMADATKVILPVWHGVTENDVRKYSAPLAVRLAGRTDDGMIFLATELADVILESAQTESIPDSQTKDEVSLAKQAILTLALPKNQILVIDSTLTTARHVNIADYSYDDCEKQRKLFLYALQELENSGLVEKISDCVRELTYSGLQVAERLTPLREPHRLGMS